MEKVQLLEPIQEESEPEDETVGGRKEEANEEEEEEKEDELAFQVGVQTEEDLAENEREEDDAPLRILRPGRRSDSMRWERFIQIQFNKQKKETENSSGSDASTYSTDQCKEAAGLPVFGNERRLSSGELRIKMSKKMWQKQTGTDKPKKKRVSRYKNMLEPFPKWLVHLMVNIEEATNHQLVAE